MKWNLNSFAGKDVVFIGKGREGLSFEAFIGKYGAAASFRFVDQTDGPDYLDKLALLDQNRTIIVKTPGCPGRLVPVPYTTPTNVFFDLAQLAGMTIVGVTGTKGKSTTASLISHFLRAGGIDNILCGNIGKPMLDYLDQATADQIFVVELGAFMTADLTRSPHIAVYTNLYAEHMDFFGSETAYYAAKKQMIAHASSADSIVYNPDFALIADWAAQSPAKAIPIDPAASALVDLSTSKLIGEHNKLNVLIASKTAEQFGVDQAACLQSLQSFEPLAHRLQSVATIHGVTYIDDAISTTPESTIAALQAVQPVSCLLLGGLDRGYDFTNLGNEIAKLQIPALVFFPDSGAKIEAALPQSYKPATLHAETMDQAVQFAAQHASPQSSVLLSCASPSYSLWKDFEAKGDDFQRAVASLSKN